MNNLLIAFFGWAAWTTIVLRIDKETYDDNNNPFPLKAYAAKNWDNWLASLCMIPILLIIAAKGWGNDVLGVVDFGHLGWTDAYTLGSGFFTEAIVFAFKKWRQNKQA